MNIATGVECQHQRLGRRLSEARAFAETLPTWLLRLRLLQTILPAAPIRKCCAEDDVVVHSPSRAEGGWETEATPATVLSIGRTVPRNRSCAGDEEYERTVSQEEEARPPLDLGFKDQRGSDALPIPGQNLLTPCHSTGAGLKIRPDPNHTYARCLRLSRYRRVTTYSPPFRRRSPYSPVDKGQTSSTSTAFTRTERCI